jgi:hypothetical protein
MTFGALLNWLQTQATENPSLLKKQLGYVDIGCHADYADLQLVVTEETRYDGTPYEEVVING